METAQELEQMASQVSAIAGKLGDDAFWQKAPEWQHHHLATQARQDLYRAEERLQILVGHITRSV